MTDAVGRTNITQVGAVFVPVTDQVRSLEFYRDTLGFELRVDFRYGGGLRWIEVAPPGATNTIALVPPGEGRSPGGNATYCAFASRDIDADHARLVAGGVDVDAEVAGTGRSRRGLIGAEESVADPVPAQFFISDPDGNRFLIVQSG